MNTKIDSYQALTGRPVAGSAPAKSPVAVAGESGGKAVASVAPTDSVSLTGNARQLQQFQKTLSAVPDTDSGRVDRLRQAVSDGSYQVDSKSVAAKLSRFEFTMGSA